MKRVNNVSLGLILLLACLLFAPFVYFVPRVAVFELCDALLIALALGSIVGFHPAAVDAMRLPPHELTAGQVLVVGVVLGSVAFVVIFAGQYLWRWYDKPDAIIDSAFLAFSRWFLAISWGLTLIASGSQKGQLPPSTYKRAGVFVFLAVAIFGVIFTLWGLSRPTRTDWPQHHQIEK